MWANGNPGQMAMWGKWRSGANGNVGQIMVMWGTWRCEANGCVGQIVMWGRWRCGQMVMLGK